VTFDLNTNVANYIHNKQSVNSGKLGVLLAYESSNREQAIIFANQICMHIAASSPIALDEKGISNDFLENEKKIMSEQLINEGKKTDMIDKILSGKISKIIKDNTLLGQKWVLNPEITVADSIKNFEIETKSSFVIKKFVRYKVGEGIEIKKNDFADEVKNLTK